MKTNRMNPQGIGEIRNFMESIIQDDETPYVLAKEIFNIYYSDKNFNVNNIVFILNASFLSKRYERNEYGGNLIYLCNDLFYDCLKNLEYRKMILEPTFLGGEYRKVSPTSYKLLFNSCKNQISIDEMIRKCKKRKNRSALIEIKKFINS